MPRKTNLSRCQNVVGTMCVSSGTASGSMSSSTAVAVAVEAAVSVPVSLTAVVSLLAAPTRIILPLGRRASGVGSPVRLRLISGAIAPVAVTVAVVGSPCGEAVAEVRV